jgi:hypothetical protein
MGGALQLWLPVERFDDAMLLLRHTLHWELIDITYAVLFDSRRAAATRWDGKRIKPTPKTKARIAHTHAYAYCPSAHPAPGSVTDARPAFPSPPA